MCYVCSLLMLFQLINFIWLQSLDSQAEIRVIKNNSGSLIMVCFLL